MHYLLIIEGPDNIGKTTLAKAIQRILNIDDYDVQYKHFGAPVCTGEAAHREELHKLEDELKDLNTWSDKRYDRKTIKIFDRSSIDELVYGPIFRGCAISTTYKSRIEQLINSKKWKTKIIVFYANEQTYIKHNIKPKELEINAYQKRTLAQRISNKFIKILKEYPPEKTLFVNCNKYESFEERNSYIMEQVKKWFYEV